MHVHVYHKWTQPTKQDKHEGKSSGRDCTTNQDDKYTEQSIYAGLAEYNFDRCSYVCVHCIV